MDSQLGRHLSTNIIYHCHVEESLKPPSSFVTNIYNLKQCANELTKSVPCTVEPQLWELQSSAWSISTIPETHLYSVFHALRIR